MALSSNKTQHYAPVLYSSLKPLIVAIDSWYSRLYDCKGRHWIHYGQYRKVRWFGWPGTEEQTGVVGCVWYLVLLIDQLLWSSWKKKHITPKTSDCQTSVSVWWISSQNQMDLEQYYLKFLIIATCAEVAFSMKLMKLYSYFIFGTYYIGLLYHF